MQQSEDQVINQVVSGMDEDADGVISRKEVLVFFADLLGIQLGGLVDLVADLTNEQLLMAAAGLSIHKDTFVKAWHRRFHDNLDFVGATFDRFDINGDGLMNALEIEGIVNNALNHGDRNQDGQLEKDELALFLEVIYKVC
ncbi:hypothetical protein V1264_024536 [Littorina saxatilis]|uniref:EF-hand domain-containing protein n=2 Tax=Littorina saxatilis TaxID=31220 RepID=A0AAN9AM36_9CAEN